MEKKAVMTGPLGLTTGLHRQVPAEEAAKLAGAELTLVLHA